MHALTRRLHHAAATGDVAALTAELAAGAAVDARDGEPTPLHVAISARQADAVTLLLARGADPEALAWGRTPLSAAAQLGGYPPERAAKTPSTVRIIEALLAAGARVDRVVGDPRYLPLRIALETATLPIVDALLAGGATLEAAWAPVALEHRRVDALPRFFERCPDLDLDACLFALTIHAGDAGATAEALLARGANPNATDEAGATPVLWAAYWRRPAVLAALVARGGDLDRATTKTWCPEDQPLKRGLTPRAYLSDALRFEHREGLDEGLRVEWGALAAACGDTLDGWLARLSAKPSTPRLEGRWVAALARVDGDQGPYDLLEALAGDGVEVNVTLVLSADATFTLAGCESLLGGSGTWRREGSTVQLDFDDGEERSLEVTADALELIDETSGTAITWTLERET